MRRIQRAVLIALLVGAGPVLTGCADFDLDKLDFLGLNQKKKLPGERRPVFPEGVPGVTQGIPPEYMKGHEQAQTGAAVPLDGVKPEATADNSAKPDEKKTATAEPAAKPKPKKAKRVAQRPPRKTPPQGEQPAPAAAQPAAQATAAPAAQPANGAQGWPPPAQPQGSPWPAPVPAGTFSKQ